VSVGGASFEVVPGQLITILPNEPHWYGAAERHPWTIYWCHAAGPAAEKLGAILRQDEPSPILEIEDQPRLAGLFEEIANELAGGYGISHLIPASMALAHLLGLAIASRRHHKAPSDAILRVRRAIGYMQQRREEQISIPELASMANLSSSHFCAIFKKVTGFAPLDYFIRLKVRRACELLDGTNFSVKRIAAELGFSDALYLSRVFRRIHGMAPTEYRNTTKG
jgi:AraC-like DNA-binding protein